MVMAMSTARPERVLVTICIKCKNPTYATPVFKHILPYVTLLSDVISNWSVGESFCPSTKINQN